MFHLHLHYGYRALQLAGQFASLLVIAVARDATNHREERMRLILQISFVTDKSEVRDKALG